MFNLPPLFPSIHFQRSNCGFEIQQRQRNRELWKFSFRMMEALLNFLSVHSFNIGIQAVSQNLIFACKKYSYNSAKQGVMA